MTHTAPSVPARRPLVVLPLVWTAIILVLTLTPAQEMPVTPHWELLAFDTAAHAGVFLVLSALWYFSVRRQRRFPALRQQAFGVVLLGAVLLGALIEVLQMMMQLGRNGEWSDLISDSIGVLAGLLLMRAVRRWWA